MPRRSCCRVSRARHSNTCKHRHADLERHHSSTHAVGALIQYTVIHQRRSRRHEWTGLGRPLIALATGKTSGGSSLKEGGLGDGGEGEGRGGRIPLGWAVSEDVVLPRATSPRTNYPFPGTTLRSASMCGNLPRSQYARVGAVLSSVSYCAHTVEIRGVRHGHSSKALIPSAGLLALGRAETFSGSTAARVSSASACSAAIRAARDSASFRAFLLRLLLGSGFLHGIARPEVHHGYHLPEITAEFVIDLRHGRAKGGVGWADRDVRIAARRLAGDAAVKGPRQLFAALHEVELVIHIPLC